MVEPDRPQMTIHLRRMRCACRRAKAGIQTHTYVLMAHLCSYGTLMFLWHNSRW